ncbi:MAG: dTDP-glucose 4,6-dehydratase [Ruminococcaceae bacterium]|nr:dTDP-glucose 4,6-dehydratase [Oscillospiraceae bacterium]
MKYLVTGGAGFIGSNFISYILNNYPDAELVCLDSLTYAGNVSNFAGFDKCRFTFEYADICDRERVFELTERYMPDFIVNFAAESHVDRSILYPTAFVSTNVLGTANLLDAAKQFKISRFHQVSTDEVYGDVDAPHFSVESDTLCPSSPYSASKASADMLVLSYFRTFGLPVTVSRCSNNYGPGQFPEKLIPLIIYNIMNDKPIGIYGNGLQCRDWLYVEDHCRAVDMIIQHGREGEIYNIGSMHTVTNLEMVDMLVSAVGRTALVDHITDRPGHDKRYALSCDKIKGELGWTPCVDIEKGLAKTVKWYMDNRDWCEDIMNGKYIEKNKEYIK